MSKCSVIEKDQFIELEQGEYTYHINDFDTNDKYDLEVYFRKIVSSNVTATHHYYLPSDLFELSETGNNHYITFDDEVDFSEFDSFRIVKPLKPLNLNYFSSENIDLGELNENFEMLNERSAKIEGFIENRVVKLDKKNNDEENTVLPPLKENETWLGMVRIDGNDREICGVALNGYNATEKEFDGVEVDSLISTTIEETFDLVVGGTHEIELNGFKGNLLINVSVEVSTTDEYANYGLDISEVGGDQAWFLVSGYFGTKKNNNELLTLTTEKDLKVIFDGEDLNENREIKVILEILTLTTEI